MKDTSRQHGPEGGNHLCVQCTTLYWCATVHADNCGPMLPGGRCCPACKRQNMLDLDKIETGRRARLYA